LKGTSNVREPGVTKISKIVAAELDELQLKYSIPSVSHTCIFLMICVYQEEYKNLTKSLEGKGNIKTLKSKIHVFQEDIKQILFDISACRHGEFSASCS
jgi:hypothetical protein